MNTSSHGYAWRLGLCALILVGSMVLVTAQPPAAQLAKALQICRRVRDHYLKAQRQGQALSIARLPVVQQLAADHSGQDLAQAFELIVQQAHQELYVRIMAVKILHALGRVSDARMVLSRLLDSGEPVQLRAALITLCELPAIKAPAKYLLELLRRDDHLKERAADIMIARYRHQALKPALQTRLQALLHHQQPAVRRLAVKIMGYLKTRKALRLLTSSLHDPYPEVRAAAIQALSQQQPPNFAATLQKVLQQETCARVRAVAILIFSVPPYNRKTYLPFLLKLWKRSQQAYAQVQPRLEQARQRYTQVLSQSGRNAARVDQQQLQDLGDLVLLRQRQLQEQTLIMAALLQTLPRLDQRSPQILHCLCTALQLVDSSIRSNALYALTKLDQQWLRNRQAQQVRQCLLTLLCQPQWENTSEWCQASHYLKNFLQLQHQPATAADWQKYRTTQQSAPRQQ